MTNVEGQAMARAYAVGDLVASETRFDGTTVAYGYDTDGNLASLSFPGETLSFAYDLDAPTSPPRPVPTTPAKAVVTIKVARTPII